MKKILLVGAASLGALTAGSAHAQSVNYNDLQEVFGEPVTTSVTGAPQRASEAAASLTIITKEEIARAPSRDVASILSDYAGIDVAHWSAGGADVHVRGGVRPANQSLLVLVNGRQVYLDHFGVTIWSALGVQLEEIQQIEVVKGPNSALFGFNAATGVINIITVNPLQSQQLVATAEGGSAGQLRGSISLAQKLGENIGIRLSGGYETEDQYDSVQRALAAKFPTYDHADMERKEVAGDIAAQIDDSMVATLSGSYTQTNHDIYLPGLSFIRSDLKTKSVGLNVARDMGWGIVTGKVYHNWVDMENDQTYDNVRDLDMDNRLLVASLEALIRADGANTLRVGAEYRHNTFRATPGFTGDTTFNILSASAMWNSELSDKLTFTIAGRIDNLDQKQDGYITPSAFTEDEYSRTLTVWSLNTALLVKLDDASTLRFGAGRGIQMPSLLNVGIRFPVAIPGSPFPFISFGNPTLDPTVSWNGEVGYTRRLDSIGGNFSLTGFFSRTTDIVSQPVGAAATYTPPTYPFIAAPYPNVGDYSSYGVEASLTGKFGTGWHWGLNYTWNGIDDDVDTIAGIAYPYNLSLETSTPEHKVKGRLSYVNGPWTASGAVRYTSSTEQLLPVAGVNTRYQIDGIVDFDAKLAYRLTDNIQLSISGENLNGAEDTVFVTPRRVRGALQVSF